MRKFFADVDGETVVEGYADGIEDAVEHTLDNQRSRAYSIGVDFINPDRIFYEVDDQTANIYFAGRPTIYIYMD